MSATSTITAANIEENFLVEVSLVELPSQPTAAQTAEHYRLGHLAENLGRHMKRQAVAAEYNSGRNNMAAWYREIGISERSGRELLTEARELELIGAGAPNPVLSESIPTRTAAREYAKASPEVREKIREKIEEDSNATFTAKQVKELAQPTEHCDPVQTPTTTSALVCEEYGDDFEQLGEPVDHPFDGVSEHEILAADWHRVQSSDKPSSFKEAHEITCRLEQIFVSVRAEDWAPEDWNDLYLSLSQYARTAKNCSAAYRENLDERLQCAKQAAVQRGAS